MHQNMKTTALIILNYNNVEDTINCIDSVELYNSAPVKLVVVDNGSSRTEAPVILDEYMRAKFNGRYIRITDKDIASAGTLPYATLLVSGSNDGYARGNNKGLKLTDNDPEISDVMILNNDILFVEDIIPALSEARTNLPDCALISPLLLKRDRKSIDYNCARRAISVDTLIKNHLTHYLMRLCGRSEEHFMRKRYLLLDPTIEHKSNILPIDLPSGSCMLIDKSLFKSIGFFDPGTFLYYEEDILYRKLIATGHRNYLVSNLHCVHLGAASTTQRGTPVTIRANIESERYYVRNFSGVSPFMKRLHGLTSRLFWLTLRLQKKICPSGITHRCII